MDFWISRNLLELIKERRAISLIVPAKQAEDCRVGNHLYVHIDDEEVEELIALHVVGILETYVFGLTKQHMIETGGYDYKTSYDALVREYPGLENQNALVNVLYVVYNINDRRPLNV